MGAFEELQAAAEQAALQRAVDEAERDCAAGWLLEHEDVMARMQRWIGEDEPDDRYFEARDEGGIGGALEPSGKHPELFAEGLMADLQEVYRQWEDKERREGQRQTLLKQLAVRFGALSDAAVRCIQAATAEQLDRWTERVLTAGRLEEVLGEG